MFYLISKLLPLFFLPLGLGLIFIIIGTLKKRRKVLWFGTLIIFIFSLGIISENLWTLIEKPWRRISANNSQNADAIVVLSGSLNPVPSLEKIIEWKDPDRFLAGIELFKERKAPLLIFTMGKDPFLKNVAGEGRYYFKKAVEMNIPEGAILTTGEVINTLEEARETKKLINSLKNKPKKIILVTSAFHMKRSKKVFEREGLSVYPFPVDFRSKGKWSGNNWKDPKKWLPNAKNLSDSSNALREIIGRIFYRTF